jgi:hypothetical protein
MGLITDLPHCVFRKIIAQRGDKRTAQSVGRR